MLTTYDALAQDNRPINLLFEEDNSAYAWRFVISIAV